MANTLSPKKKIFNAAVDCFSMYSYSDTTMEMIAGKIGVTAASIYNHYKNKDGILLSIFEYYLIHFNKYRTSIDDIIEAANHRPISEVFKSMFFRFGSETEHPLMLKITRIIFNLRFEHEEAGKVYDICFRQEPSEYLTLVLGRLVEMGAIAPIDIPTLVWLMKSHAVSTLNELLTYPENHAECEELFEKGALMLAKLVDN